MKTSRSIHKNFFVWLCIALPLLGFYMHEESLNEKAMGSWYLCGPFSDSMGDTIKFTKDFCFQHGYQQLNLKDSGKYAYSITGVVLQSVSYGKYTISDDILVLTGTELEQSESGEYLIDRITDKELVVIRTSGKN